MALQRVVLFVAVWALVMLLAGPRSMAQAPLRDPNLPSVPPETLQHLSDNRARQEIMRESQAHYPGRCVCPYQTRDSNGRSCKGRHEVVKTRPAPLCYPAQVSSQMVRDWRRRH